ncbi:MAG: glucan endo-1,6-beta-glucosidase [Bacteroidetes bacterium]|nr:glucan endo-1,6-beta-glucosidase [Bacteroidota bacterium]
MRKDFARFLPLLFLGSLVFLLNCKSKSQPEPVPPTPVDSVTAKVWLTKGDKSKLFNREADLPIKSQGSANWPVIIVDTATLLQTIEGFGAALTGSSAYLFHQKLNDGARQTVLTNLFDTVNGAGISFMRLSIGASDFSVSTYSYDDLPTSAQTDYTLEHFTMSRDTEDVIPMLKEILKISPGITLLGSPWSPPAWMKTNGSMIGGSLKTNCYDVYADYFVKYIQQMKSQGITIAAITPQNEPLYSAASYPCMSMLSNEEASFIKDHLGPKFQSAGISTKIIIYDHNWDNINYSISIFNNAGASQYVTGSAFHGYGGDVSAMSSVHTAFPDKGLYFTEISGGTWAPNFSDNLMWNMKNIFIGTTQNWSKCALMWNLALDQYGAPHANNSSTCRGVVTVNTSSGLVTYNEDYYSIIHFSKFVRPGASRTGITIPTNLNNIGAVAFKNPDGSKALVVTNYSSSMKTFSVKQGAKNFDYSIPAYSVVSVIWK